MGKNKFNHTLLLIFSLFLLLAGYTNAQLKNDTIGTTIISKVFPLVAFSRNSPYCLKLIRDDSELNKITQKYNERIEAALKQCEDVACYATAVQWTDEEIALIGDSLVRFTRTSKEFKLLIEDLKKSGFYNLYETYDDAEFIRAAWKNVATGVNKTLDVYVKGKRPFYALIDSISFSPGDEKFLDSIKKILVSEFKAGINKSFFDLPVDIAVNALILNQRDESVRYEPLNDGMNKTAFEKKGIIDWSKYKYSLILVPGQGPEKNGVAIDPQGIIRCKLAAKYFNKELAPFIVVSGGHVHPNKTPFCEAVEMKKYMIKELNLPEDCIFIEPHARHTTTNIRNVARMVYRFGIPADKKILIVTDPKQNAFLLGMERRFMSELNCIPYRDLKKINEESSEYLPARNALQCNSADPLDP